MTKKKKPADYLFWALKQKTGNPVRNLILIILADHMGAKGCYPSQATIADRADCTRATTHKHCKELARLGFIEIQKKYTSEGAQTSHEYSFPPMIAGVKNIDRGCIESLQGVSNNYTGGCKESLHETPISKHPVKHPVKHTPIPPSAFDEFYAAYPKKSGRVVAQKAWNKLDPQPELINRILNDLIQRVEQGHWCTGEGKSYIPGPAVYLNQQRWEDDIIPRPEFKPTVEQSVEKTKLMLAEMDRDGSWIQ